MIRGAIYARYSSDLQSDTSIEDQIRLCTTRIEEKGWKLFQPYTDHAVSAASMMRPGIQMLMQDAAAGKFDVIVAEALDRLSRDQEDIAGIYKRMQFAGVTIFTLTEGEINTLHIGLKGTMNAIFLKDLAEKTRRGLSGRIEKGKSGGGISYGYDVVRQLGADGGEIRGERRINPEQADIVIRIFREYAAGRSPKAIAHQLNREDVPCPSGKAWGPSTINGNRKRGTGILNNELYIGTLVWNRQRFLKDPDTGKRIPRLNPECEWIRKDVPELRIIEQDLWDKVRARQQALSHNTRSGKFWANQRPKNLFSFLLKCGCCGGGYSKISQTHYGCSTARNKGTCSNRLSIKQEVLEKAVLNALQHHLMDPELCRIFCDEYMKQANQLRMAKNAKVRGLKSELEKLAGDKAKIVQAIKDGVPASELLTDLNRIISRREEIEGLLEDTDEAPVLLHPAMADRYRQEVTALRESLNDPEGRTEAADLLRSLIERIELNPKKDGTGLAINLYGDLAGILSIASGRDKPLVVNDLSHQQDKMVAGARFEPTTFGL